MVSKRGKIVRTDEITLPEGNIATTKYVQKARQVLRSQLNGKNKILPINRQSDALLELKPGQTRR